MDDTTVLTSAAAATPAVVVHEATKLLPKARGGASHMCVDKAFDKRVRVTEEQKAKTVQHYLRKPSMSYSDLGLWCKDEFTLDKAPSNATLCSWLKPEKRTELLKTLATEISSAKL